MNVETEFADAGLFGILDDFPIIVVPRPVLPVRTAAAKRDVGTFSSHVLVAIEFEPRPVPDVCDGFSHDIAHGSIG